MMYIKRSIWSGFEIKNWIEDQFQSSPKLVGIWTVLRCIFVPNLEIVTSIGGESWHGQLQNGVNFDFEVKFDLEGQAQSPPKTIGILTKVFYTYGLNLVILAWTGDALSRGQASAYRTHRRTDGHTDRQTQATTIPEGQNWPRVKTLPQECFVTLFPELYAEPSCPAGHSPGGQVMACCLTTTVASFTKEINPRLAKRPLKINGRLANRGLTSLVKEATEHQWGLAAFSHSPESNFTGNA